MPKELKQIPEFTSEDEEFEFWATHDSTEYLDWSNAIKNPTFSNLKRTEGIESMIIPPDKLQYEH